MSVIVQKNSMKTINSRITRLFHFGVILVWCFTASTEVKTQGLSPVPVHLEVPFAPIPVKAMDKVNLVYELHVTNFSRTARSLLGVEVLSGESLSTPLASYREAELLKRLEIINKPADAQEKNLIGGGQRAIVFLAISADATILPATLHHRLFFKSTDSGSEIKEQSVEGMSLAIQNDKPLVLGSPLRGRWMAANGLSNDTGHRRTILTIDGQARIAQRFATDWIKLGEDGLAVRGDMSKNTSFEGYGAEVLAVANAVVAGVKDGIPENVPLIKKRAVPITLETIGGNYVMLDIGHGRFALYAHLQPGSLKVKAGDKVRLGQVLGLLGNSGNSDAPHLHFHIVNTKSPLGGEGMPYVFKSFIMQGVVKSTAEAVQKGFKPEANSESKRQMELPIENAVVLLP